MEKIIFQLKHLIRPPTYHVYNALRTSTTYLCIFGLVLFYNEVTKWMVFPNKENITTKAISSA